MNAQLCPVREKGYEEMADRIESGLWNSPQVEGHIFTQWEWYSDMGQI